MPHTKINKQVSVKPKTVHTTKRFILGHNFPERTLLVASIAQSFLNTAAPVLHDLSNTEVKIILCSTHRKPSISWVCMGCIKNEINMRDMDKLVTVREQDLVRQMFLFGLVFYIITLSNCVPCIVCSTTQYVVHRERCACFKS